MSERRDKVNCCIKICSFLTARTNTLSLILRFWAHKAKERRYILFWVCTHQYIHFIENGLVSSWNLKTNNELSHSLYCFYFSNLDKSLNCFEYKHRSVERKMVPFQNFNWTKNIFYSTIDYISNPI